MPGKKRKATKKAAAGKKKTELSTEAACHRPKKYKQWSDESMLGAIRSVTEGTGVNRAALEFCVPVTTLKDRVSGRVQHGSKSGKTPYLSLEEEEELVDYIVTCSNIGYPKTRDEIIGIVRKTLENKNGGPVEDYNGKGWWGRFMQRWPKLSLRKGDALGKPRANAVNAASIRQYYDLLEETLKKHGILNSPSRVYNMDESGMPLDHKPPKVVTLKGTKKVHCHTSGNKAQITILACANAAGNVIPPMVIFEGKRLNPEWTKGEVPDTLYGMSDKGWTDMELFRNWMTSLFIPNIPSARPVLLLIDGHSSHYEPETIRLAAKEGIIILCLPPHTTHVSQPLDISFFRPLKVYWSEGCHKYMQNNPGRTVTKYQFSALFSVAWYKAIKAENLVSGFRKAGIYPYNANAIRIPDLPPSSAEPEVEPEKDMDTNSFDKPVFDSDSSALASSSFTYSTQELEMFSNRYENGYVKGGGGGTPLFFGILLFYGL